jgi:hypothetical protein
MTIESGGMFLTRSSSNHPCIGANIVSRSSQLIYDAAQERILSIKAK